MNPKDLESLILCAAPGAITGAASAHDAGRVIEILARLELSLVDAESATEIYACIVNTLRQHKKTIDADAFRSWSNIADRFALHVQRLNDPAYRKRRHIVIR